MWSPGDFSLRKKVRKNGVILFSPLSRIARRMRFSFVLRAELDENTCRKPLTPVEASKARERRAKVLEPTQPKGGRGKTSAPTWREFRRLLGRPGRSLRSAPAIPAGSTLDKVDVIRDAAERGVIRRGKTTVPAPEPVKSPAPRSPM